MNMEMEVFTNWLNHHAYFDILYLYNGPELGYEDDKEIKSWLKDYGLKTTKNMKFYEKGYAFFRDMMDSGANDEQIIALGKYMIGHKLIDKRDITGEHINGVDDRWMDEDYMFFIPELLDKIKRFLKPGDKSLLIGGGEYECFKEVLLLLEMMDIDCYCICYCITK